MTVRAFRSLHCRLGRRTGARGNEGASQKKIPALQGGSIDSRCAVTTALSSGHERQDSGCACDRCGLPRAVQCNVGANGVANRGRSVSPADWSHRVDRTYTEALTDLIGVDEPVHRQKSQAEWDVFPWQVAGPATDSHQEV
jgi:hypothetical protein